MKKVVKLPEPIEGVSELVFVPLVAKHYIGVDMRRFGLQEWAAEDIIRIMANNTGAPISVIGNLPNDTFHESIGVMLDFFETPSATSIAEGSTSQTGASSSST